MNKNKKKKIFFDLIPYFKDNSFSEHQLLKILDKSNIKEDAFFYYFPEKIKSLSYYYFEIIANEAQNKVKEKLAKEKSISKRISILLIEYFISLNNKDKITIFFLNYLSIKPILFKKISLNYASGIWRILNDKSVDFNYYTKRFLLSQIFINSALYWRGARDIEETIIFINNQIQSLGKVGYYKTKLKTLFNSLTKKNCLSKFDLLHRN
tara:strand:- start:549 stop:1175 length:627 start_codon:yes stop_codon:yes gene_type:complete